MLRFRVSILVLAPLAVAAIAAAGAFAGTTTAAAVGCSGSGVQMALTAHYRLTLRIGPSEKMYTPAQVRTMHPKHGEVMIRGTMMSMGSMSMGSVMRHLEVQICSRKTSTVVTNAHPVIDLVDNSTDKTTKVPIAVMEGIGEGVADLHYGNNVAMHPGHRYTVRVSVMAEHAIFHLRLPKRTM